MATSGYESLIECPYDKSHQILSHRFQTHLVKCRKQHKDKKMATCPLNVVHIVPEPELFYHISVCPNKAQFDLYKYATGTPSKFPEPNQPSEFREPVSCSENWDNCDYKSYDPMQYVENASLLRTIQGATPSERKEFRNAEKMRLNALKNLNERTFKPE